MDPGHVAAAGLKAVPAESYVEIGEAESFGMVGGAWRTVELDPAMNPGFAGGGPPAVGHLKSFLERSGMQIVFGNDPSDPGQALLWKAMRSPDAFPFRILFPGGALRRSWAALVVGMNEVFDTANSVILLQADLLPVSEILRSEVP